MQLGIRVAATLSIRNALAAGLTPPVELGAGGGDVRGGGRRAAVAGGAGATRAVSTTVVC